MKRSWQRFSKLSSNAKVAIALVIAVMGWGIGSAATSHNTTQPAAVKTAQTCTASTTTQTQTQSIPFGKKQVNDPSLDQGKTAVTTQGVNGEKTITNKVTSYSPNNCKPTVTQEVSESITTQPVDEVTSVGTKAPAPAPTPAPAPSSPSCSPYYTPCVPNVSYDLDCKDIGMRVSVHGGDPYHLDADHDGIGCESY